MPSKVIIPETFLLGKLKTVDRIRIFQISVVCHSENTAISGKVLPAFPVHAVFFLPLNPYCCWQGTEELNDDIKHLKINKLTLVTEVLSLACQYKSNHELAGFKHVPDIQGRPVLQWQQHGLSLHSCASSRIFDTLKWKSILSLM